MRIIKWIFQLTETLAISAWFDECGIQLVHRLFERTGLFLILLSIFVVVVVVVVIVIVVVCVCMHTRICAHISGLYSFVLQSCILQHNGCFCLTLSI